LSLVDDGDGSTGTGGVATLDERAMTTATPVGDGGTPTGATAAGATSPGAGARYW
jgi:hypothetical protein